MNDQDARALSIAWFYKEQFGFSKAPPISDPEVVRNMARALLASAGGDGDLSEAERAWIVGYFATKGYPVEVLEEIRTQAPAQADDVAELMKLGILAKSGRILIYDAVRAASADGYSAGERSAVRRVAEVLGVAEGDVREIEAIVAEEGTLRARRIAVLMPGGHPNL